MFRGQNKRLFLVKRGRFLLLFLTISILFSGVAGFSRETDSLSILIKDISSSYSVLKANRIMSWLQREGSLENPELFLESSPKEEVMMNVFYFSADCLYANQQYAKCAEYASKALDYSLESKDKDFQADALSLLAISNMRMGNYDKAGYYAEQCYALDLESGDHDRISSSLNTLAGIYMSAKRYEAAEKYVLKGIAECAKTKNEGRMGILLGMASEVYHAMGKSDVALEYAQKAYDLEKKIGREPQAMVRLSQRAAALIGLGRYEDARRDLLVAIPYFRSSGNLQSLGISCNKMGGVLYYLNQTDEAAKYYAEAAGIFVTLGDPYNEMHSRKGLYESLLETDGREAKRQHDIYDRLKDSLYNLAMAESLSRYNASMENDSLKAENIRARKAKITILVAGILAALVVATLVWLVMLHRVRRQKAAMEDAIRRLRSEYLNLKSNYEGIIQSRNEGADNPSENPSEQGIDTINKSDRIFLDKLASYVISNLETGRLGVEDIASHMCLSSGQLNRKMKSITGNTTQNYVLRLRLEQARILLQSDSESPIADIAYRCGFEDAATFSRAFKRVFDSTPSQMRG